MRLRRKPYRGCPRCGQITREDVCPHCGWEFLKDADALLADAERCDRYGYDIDAERLRATANYVRRAR